MRTLAQHVDHFQEASLLLHNDDTVDATRWRYTGKPLQPRAERACQARPSLNLINNTFRFSFKSELFFCFALFYQLDVQH
jgi:hypothetical protein